MCAEDEPITLKEKACRSVCSIRQWVMIERGNPLSAVTQVTSKVKKFRDKTLKTNRVRGTPDRIGIVGVGDLPEERRIWLSHIEDDGEKKYGAESTNQEFWSEKRKLLHTTGSVLKLTVAVSVTISISVQKWHSRIRLRFFHATGWKRPEVREEECPCGRMCPMAMQGLRQRNVHRLILKSGTLQNTCSTRLKSGGRLGEKCSHAHRQFDEQPFERSKRNYQ